MISVLVHVGAIAPVCYSAQTAAAERLPCAFAVQASMLEHASAPAAQPSLPPPPCETEAPADLELAEPDLPLAEAPLVPPPAAVPVECRVPPRVDERLAAVATSAIRAPRPVAAPLAAAAPATPVPPLPEAAAPSVAQQDRPEVPVPIPGQNPEPEYPAAARRRGIEGVVVVRIAVDMAGAAADCEVLHTSGSVLLDRAALDAARRWRFEHGPGMVEQAFRFQIVVAR